MSVSIAQKRANLRKAFLKANKPGEDLLDIFRRLLDRNKMDIRITQDITDGIEQTVITLVDLESLQEETNRINRAPYATKTIEKWIRVNFMLLGAAAPCSQEQVDFILKNSTTEQLQKIAEKYQINDLRDLTQDIAAALIKRIQITNGPEGRQKR